MIFKYYTRIYFKNKKHANLATKVYKLYGSYKTNPTMY